YSARMSVAVTPKDPVKSGKTPAPEPARDVTTAHQSFVHRHIGPSAADTREMLGALGCATLDALIDSAVPSSIRLRAALQLPEPLSETEALTKLKGVAS